MKIEEVIKQLESIADHVCSMAASPDADNIWRKDIDALEFALTALRSMSESGEYHFRDDTKLSLEQLKQMDGKPVWIEDTSCWGLVFIPKAGQFKNSPFVLFRKEGVQFEWHVTDSELTIYSYPPAHIDRSEWISVKERLPKDFDQALVYDGDEHYPIGICHKGESGIWHSDMAYGMGTITHWMPLPEPPEEG